MWWANVLRFTKRCHSPNKPFLEKTMFLCKQSWIIQHCLHEFGCMNDVLNVTNVNNVFDDLRVLLII